jgi:hypothetical protein
MTITERTSADAHDRHIRGRLIASSNGQAWKDVLVQILSRLPLEESVLVPAVAEPLIVWILSGTATVEERDIGGTWTSSEVEVGDFFLTTSPTPYEMRWKATGAKPFECRLADAGRIRSYGLFVWDVVKAHVAISPKNPKTLHYRGQGEFMVAGRSISRKDKFKPQNL